MRCTQCGTRMTWNNEKELWNCHNAMCEVISRKAPRHEMNPLAKDMTLRDYFAGQVLAGLATLDGESFDSLADATSECYKIADAMIEARKK